MYETDENCTGTLLGFVEHSSEGCQGDAPTDALLGVGCGGLMGVVGARIDVNTSFAFRIEATSNTGAGAMRQWINGASDGVIVCNATVPIQENWLESAPLAAAVAPSIESVLGMGAPPAGTTPLRFAASPILTVFTNDTGAVRVAGQLLRTAGVTRAVVSVRATFILVSSTTDDAFTEFPTWQAQGRFNRSTTARLQSVLPAEMFAAELTLPLDAGADLLCSCEMADEGQVVLTYYARDADTEEVTLLWTQSYQLPLELQVAISSSFTPFAVLGPDWQVNYICYTFQTALYRAQDLNKDDKVNLSDLIDVVNAWGAHDPSAPCVPTDFDCNGNTDLTDLVELVNVWSP